MLILTRAEVEELLDPQALIDAVAEAMADLSAGRASMPDRTAVLIPEQGAISVVMPSYVPGMRALATKLVNAFPGNAGGPLPTHQAVVVLSDPADGRVVALVDGTSITALRTAAGSALSARLLARDDARTLAILGTGVQARSHLRTLPLVRPLQEIRVAARDPAKARALAAEVADALPCPVRAVDSFAAACEGADIVCGTTHAVEPVIRRGWLAPGTHVTSVGYNLEGVEVDAETVRDALLVVETRSIVEPPPIGANDIAWPIRDGVITPDHIHAEIGDIVAGGAPGRRSPEQLTLYKSVGVAVQDAAAAALVLRAAREHGAGREIAL